MFGASWSNKKVNLKKMGMAYLTNLHVVHSLGVNKIKSYGKIDKASSTLSGVRRPGSTKLAARNDPMTRNKIIGISALFVDIRNRVLEGARTCETGKTR